MAGGGDNKKKLQNCTDPSGQEILHFRALHSHSGRIPIDASLQDNVLIPDNFFKYIYHVGCAINLHSIKNSGSIPGGNKLVREGQTVFFTTVNPMDKEHKDPYKLDVTHYIMHLTSKSAKNSKTRCIGSKYSLLNGFYQTRSNAIIFCDTLPACCMSKVVVMETGEIIYEKVYAFPRLAPEISFRDNGMKNLGSEVAGGSEDSNESYQKSKNIKHGETREHPSDSHTQEIEKCLV